MRISDWSSDVCSSDLNVKLVAGAVAVDRHMGKRCLGIGLQGLDRSPEVVGTREREDRDGCGRVPNISGRICQIGRASCRERVCQYVEMSVVAVALEKKRQETGIGQCDILVAIR